MTKTILFLLSVFSLLSCSNGTEYHPSVCSSYSNTYERLYCATTSDTSYNSILMSVATHFEPQYVNLDATIRKDTIFLNLIDVVGINTIRKQTEYDTFLLILFLKLYQHHLSCYHQGYDLKTMRKGYATFLIDDLCELMGIDILNCEMLNEGCVVDFLSSNESYKRNALLAQIVDSINSIDVSQYF